MKPLLAFLLLQFAAASSDNWWRNQKLPELHRLLQQRPAPATPPSCEGRVFFPSCYGADPTGEEDSSDAIGRAVEEAFGVESRGKKLVNGIKDLGGVVVDLQGGNYRISRPIRFPSGGGGNVVVQGGTLRASDAFPGDRHLVELWSPKSKKSDPAHDDGGGAAPSSEIYYEDVTFRDVVFDSSFRGGGFFAVDSARVRITDCTFLHFTTQGILVHRGHETLVSSTFLGQHSTVGADAGERRFSGTAVYLFSNDNAVTDVVIFSAAVGVLVRGQANVLTGVHCYNKAAAFGGVGIWVRLPGLSQTRIQNCYLDYTGVVMEDPVQVHVSGGFFLGDANVVIRAGKKRQISGVTVVDNMFSGDAEKMKPIVELKGEFTAVDQVVIERNNVRGMGLRSTAAALTVAGNGTKWVADFSRLLVFPGRISHFQYSFYHRNIEGKLGFPAHGVTNVSGNVVVVESDRAVSAVVSVAVDQYNRIGEKPVSSSV